MGLFDLFKKKKEEPPKKGTAQPKAPPKPACEHGECIVYHENLCCNCDNNVQCSKKEKYDESHRLEPELVEFYKAHASVQKETNFERRGTKAITAASKFIKAYQPKLIFLKEEICRNIITMDYRYKLNDDALNFICRMKDVNLPNNCKDKIMYIWLSYKNNKLDITSEWLFNSSLYNRSVDDCKYTVNALNMFSQPSLYLSYLKNGDVVDINMFFDENGNIKPAGRDGSDGDTIYNIIEFWAKDNEYTPEEISERNDY